MKRILFIFSFLLIGVIAFGQSETWNKGGIKVGAKNDANLVTIKKITLIGNYLYFWNGAANYSPGVATADQVTGIALADSANANGLNHPVGSYATAQDLFDGLATKAPTSADNVGFSIIIETAGLATPLDATTYYTGCLAYATGWATTATVNYIYIPFNCTLIGYSIATRSTAACSAETGTLSVRVNNSTDILLSNTITWGVGGAYFINYFSNSNINGNITAGDRIALKLLTPTWATDATGILVSVVLYLIF
jgi:hypothetical protein